MHHIPAANMETAHTSDAPAAPESAVKKDRRRSRVRTVLLRCFLGEIVDLSQTGMRVRCRRKPRMERHAQRLSQPIAIEGHDESVRVRVRAVWVRSVGFLHHEIGLAFVDMTDEQSAALTRLARDYLDGEVLRPRNAA